MVSRIRVKGEMFIQNQINQQLDSEYLVNVLYSYVIFIKNLSPKEHGRTPVMKSFMLYRYMYTKIELKIYIVPLNFHLGSSDKIVKDCFIQNCPSGLTDFQVPQ